MKIKLLLLILVFILLFLWVISKNNSNKPEFNDNVKISWWEIQSIDTMKYSRDAAREKLKDPSFDEIIDRQVKSISETGATHVAVGTPYDTEFIPYLKRWVFASRKYGMNVWFRGNFSGWEGWFGYEKISRSAHLTLLDEFIKANGDLFEDGDIFSSCPECENGGSGDPRMTRDISGYRKFLIDEYITSSKAFQKIGKNVRSGYMSMNGDVANLIMDPETTKSLGGVVVIDHYVATPEKLARDIKNISKKSGGKVLLGEFGAPIPDIHGNLTEEAQSDWINSTLSKISEMPEVIGVNYWTGYGGSTKLWNDNNSPRKAVSAISQFYTPKILKGSVEDERGLAVSGAIVNIGSKTAYSSSNGGFNIPLITENFTVSVQKEGYVTKIYDLSSSERITITLKKKDESVLFLIQKLLRMVLNTWR